MQLVLLDTLDIAVKWEKLDWTDRDRLGLKVFVDKHVMRSKSTKRKQDDLDFHPSSYEERIKHELTSEILADDIGDLEGLLTPVERHQAVTVILACTGSSIFKKLWDRFQGQAKISAYLKYAPDEHGEFLAFPALDGMIIKPRQGTHSVDQVARGTTITPSEQSEGKPRLHMKLVADLPEAAICAKAMHSAFSRKVMEKRPFPDVTISTGDGTIVKGHKCFLSVCSPVLKAMLESGMEESQTGHLDMSDVCEAGVNAFLVYGYSGDLDTAEANPQVAFDLFYIAHKYGIPLLEAEMTRLLLERKNEDFGVPLTFKVYMFVRNIADAVKLKEKAIRILKSKADELGSLQDYNELFENASNSKTAKEIFLDFAKCP